MRPYCFILTEACSCRLEQAYFAGEISKNRLVCKNPVALAYHGRQAPINGLLASSSPSFAWSVVRDAKENREKKRPREILGARSTFRQDLARPFFFSGLFFRVSLDGVSERQITRSLEEYSLI